MVFATKKKVVSIKRIFIFSEFKKTLFLMKLIKIEVKRKIAEIDGADANKKIPIKKVFCPNSIEKIYFKNLLKSTFLFYSSVHIIKSYNIVFS